MSPVHGEYSTVAMPRPLVRYRSDDQLLHCDGCLFGFLCLVSWILFAYLWARLHWMNYLEKRERQQQRPPAMKSEQWLWPHSWRN